MTPKEQRRQQVAEGLRELQKRRDSLEYQLIIKVLEAAYDVAKEAMVSSDTENLVKVQAEARVYAKLITQMTQQSPITAKE